MTQPSLPEQAMSLAADLAGLQDLVSRCPTAADRKGLIIAAHCHGAISLEACQLLIEAYGLETA